MPTNYNAIATVPISPTPKRSAGWMSALEPYSPAVRRTDEGLSELVVTYPAKDIDQAVSTGWRLLFAAAGAVAPGSFRVLTTELHNREIDAINLQPLPSLVSVSEAGAIIGVARQRVQQLINAGQLRAVKAGNTWAIPRYEVDQVAAVRAAGMTVDG